MGNEIERRRRKWNRPASFLSQPVQKLHKFTIRQLVREDRRASANRDATGVMLRARKLGSRDNSRSNNHAEELRIEKRRQSQAHGFQGREKGILNNRPDCSPKQHQPQQGVLKAATL